MRANQPLKLLGVSSSSSPSTSLSPSLLSRSPRLYNNLHACRQVVAGAAAVSVFVDVDGDGVVIVAVVVGKLVVIEDEGSFEYQ